MLAAIRQWVIKTMMKNNTGVVQTLPKRDLIELNTQITAQRLMQSGIDPEALKNVNQVENAVNAIESRPPVQQGIKSTKSAKVFDLEGKEIKDPKNIMGGKEINQQTLNEELMKKDNPYSDLVKTTNQKPKTLKEREAEVLARMEKENKEAAQRIRDRKRLEDRAIEDFVDDAGGVNPDDPRGIDDFIPDPENMATGGRAGFASGTPELKLYPRASGRETEQEVGPGIKISERDLNYGITGLLEGDKFFGGAEIDKGKVKINVLSPEGDTLFKDTIGKKDAVNFILGMGDPKGEKFQIKTDKDFENMQLILNKKIDFNRLFRADGGRIGLKDGMDRRTFMKIMGGLATLPIVGKFAKGAKLAAPAAKKVAEITAPALDKIVETVMSAGKLVSQSGRRLKELTTKKKLKDVEVEEDMMDGPSYTIKTKDKTIYYKPGRQDEMGFDDDIIEVIEDTVTKKASGGVARMLGE